MEKQKYIKQLYRMKLAQLIAWTAIQVTYLLILICNPTVGKYVFDHKSVFVVCCVSWIFAIFGFVCLLYDFYKLRVLANETHALYRAAFLDTLAGIPNRHGLDVIFQSHEDPETIKNVGCFMAAISNLKEINAGAGREAGDQLIRSFSTMLEKIGDGYGSVGRNGGNEFLAVINDCSAEKMDAFRKALAEEIVSYNSKHAAAPIIIESVAVLNCEEHADNFPALLAATYSKLHVTH